jgi:hypothetical protein
MPLCKVHANCLLEFVAFNAQQPMLLLLRMHGRVSDVDPRAGTMPWVRLVFRCAVEQPLHGPIVGDSDVNLSTWLVPRCAEQLRQDPQLGFLEEVLVFTVHGVRKSKVKHGVEGLVDVADTIRGLSGTQQKAVLNAFK